MAFSIFSSSQPKRTSSTSLPSSSTQLSSESTSTPHKMLSQPYLRSEVLTPPPSKSFECPTIPMETLSRSVSNSSIPFDMDTSSFEDSSLYNNNNIHNNEKTLAEQQQERLFAHNDAFSPLSPSTLDDVGSLHSWDDQMAPPVNRRMTSLIGTNAGFDLLANNASSHATQDVSQLIVSPPSFEWDWKTELDTQLNPPTPSPPLYHLSSKAFQPLWEGQDEEAPNAEVTSKFNETRVQRNVMERLYASMLPSDVNPVVRCSSPSTLPVVPTPGCPRTSPTAFLLEPIPCYAVPPTPPPALERVSPDPIVTIKSMPVRRSPRIPPPPASPTPSCSSSSADSDASDSARSFHNTTPSRSYTSSPHSLVSDLIQQVGTYTREERNRLIEIYRAKRQRRIFGKRVTYMCRKKFADHRPRVAGRFVKLEDVPQKPKSKGRKSKKK